MKIGRWIIVILFLVFAAYLINVPLNFISIPEVIKKYEDWIVGVGGLFVLWGMFLYYLKYKKYY